MSNTKSTDTDQIVLQLLAKVEEKKKQIGNAERPSWNTNCSFGFDPNNNDRINIQVVRDLEVLVGIHAFLSHRYESYLNSLKSLGITEREAPFKYLGFSYENQSSNRATDVFVETAGITKFEKGEYDALRKRLAEFDKQFVREMISFDRNNIKTGDMIKQALAEATKVKSGAVSTATVEEHKEDIAEINVSNTEKAIASETESFTSST